MLPPVHGEPRVAALKNQLLAALPPDVISRLMPRLRSVPLSVRNRLMEPNTEIEAVYFIESGWVSLVTLLEDGTQAEVGIVGREGMVGLPLVTGVDTAFVEAYAQADGTAQRMDAASFLRAMEEEAEFRRLLLRYFEAMMGQIPAGGL
jgi:CRP-like cAMP-binding protein